MIDTNKIKDVVVSGIDISDYPDYCDAYIDYATIDGVEMTCEELDELNEDSMYRQYIYDQVQLHLY